MKRPFNSFVFVILIGALLYFPMLPERITWQNYGGDGGDFLSAILTKGVPHPAGYPLYIVLGTLFQFFPFQTAYWKGAFFSAFCMALAGGLLALWIEKVLLKGISRAGLIGAFSAFLWLATSLVWSQALIVEVYGLHALMVVVWIWWISALFGEISMPSWGLSFLSFLSGLGLGNHLSIGLLLPVVCWGFWDFGRKNSLKKMGIQMILFVLGLLIYGVLPLRAQANPPVNWGGANTWDGFWWLVSGNLYQGMLFDVDGNQFLSRVSAMAGLWVKDFSVLGVLLSLTGLVNVMSCRWGKISLWVFIAFGLFSLGYAAEDSQVYLIPAWMVLSIWLAMGIAKIKDWNWKKFSWGWAVLGVLALWSVWHLPWVARQVDVKEKDDAADFAEQALQNFPLNSFVVTIKDQDTFPLWFYHFGLSQRSDLRIIVLPLTPFDWYRQSLRKAYPDLHFPPDGVEGISWGDLLLNLNSERLVCRTSVETQPAIQVTYECQ